MGRIFTKVQTLYSVMILHFWTDMPGQTVQTQIRLLLGLHCLPFRVQRLDPLLYNFSDYNKFFECLVISEIYSTLTKNKANHN